MLCVSALPYLFTLLQICLTGALACGITGRIQFSPAGNGWDYGDSCVAVENQVGFARCLLQRNTLHVVLDCASIDADGRWYFTVPSGTPADSLDLVPGSLRASRNGLTFGESGGELPEDGKTIVTPKGILLWASSAFSCPAGDEYDALFEAFAKCPWQSREQFQACLCCEGVTPMQIRAFEAQCIWGPGLPSWASRELFESFPWSCRATCARVYWEDSSALVKNSDDPIARGEDDDVHGALLKRGYWTTTRFQVVDGTPTQTAPYHTSEAWTYTADDLSSYSYFEDEGLTAATRATSYESYTETPTTVTETDVDDAAAETAICTATGKGTCGEEEEMEGG